MLLAWLLLAWPLHVVIPAGQLSLLVAAFLTLFLARVLENWAGLATLAGEVLANWRA